MTREIPAYWPNAQAWIWAEVRTDHPGYRQLSIGATPITVTSGTHRADGLITQLDTDLGAASWNAAIDSAGRVTLSGSASAITYTDRLGWALGLAPVAGAIAPSSATHTSLWVSPVAIPLLGATWDEVRASREIETIVDSAGRRAGYVYGSARVWRWRITLTRWALDALREGPCLYGKITVNPYASEVDAADATTPGGRLTGYVIGVSDVTWSGPTEEIATLVLTMAGEAG